jgi:hypothetical protein
MALLRSETPAAVRWMALATLAFLILATATVVPLFFGAAGVPRVVITYALVSVAFATITLVRTPRSPQLPLVVTLAVVLIGATRGLAVMGPLVPVRRAALGGQGSLLITIALAGGVLLTMHRQRVLAFVLLIVLAINGLGGIAAAIIAAMFVNLSAAVQPWLVLNAVWIIASVAACWYGRGLVKRHDRSIDERRS